MPFIHYTKHSGMRMKPYCKRSHNQKLSGQVLQHATTDFAVHFTEKRAFNHKWPLIAVYFERYRANSPCAYSVLCIDALKALTRRYIKSYTNINTLWWFSFLYKRKQSIQLIKGAFKTRRKQGWFLQVNSTEDKVALSLGEHFCVDNVLTSQLTLKENYDDVISS